MPIKGISEKRRLRRLGRIRLGKKEPNASGRGDHPVALDHFNFEDAPELIALFGNNCKEIDVILPNEKVDAFFPQERKAYRTSGLFCRGDGENATRINVGISDGKNSNKVPVGKELDPEGARFIREQGLQVQVGEMFDMPCLGEECPFTLQKFCKPIGRFLFIVPSAPRVGVYEISTTSYNSIVELNSSIDTILGIAGRISMIPLKLRLVPKDTNVPKTTMKKVIYHLVLEYAGTFAALAQYKNVKEIPLDSLPTRRELDLEIPDDLVRKAGAALEEEIGPSKPAAAAAPVEEHPDPEPEEALEGEIVEEPVEPPPPAAVTPPKPREVETIINPVGKGGKLLKPINGLKPGDPGTEGVPAPAVKNALVKNAGGKNQLPAATPAAAPKAAPAPAAPAPVAKPRRSLFA